MQLLLLNEQGIMTSDFVVLLIGVLERRVLDKMFGAVVGGVFLMLRCNRIALDIGASMFSALDKLHFLLATACVLDQLGSTHS